MIRNGLNDAVIGPYLYNTVNKLYLGVGGFVKPAFVASDYGYHALADTHTVFIVGERKILLSLVHIAKLSAIPGHAITTVGKRIAYLVIGYVLPVIAYKKILPFAVANSEECLR